MVYSRPSRRPPFRFCRAPKPIVLVCMLLAAAACTVHTPLLRSNAGIPGSNMHRNPLKVHLHSGELVVLATWSEDTAARELLGRGRSYDIDRNPSSADTTFRIPVDAIALVETTTAATSVGYGLGITMLAAYTVLTGVVTTICVADPKSCFGSCPTFYLDGDEGGDRIAAEGFSSSIARALEATDLDDLRVMVDGGEFTLWMRNEALETHAVRHLRVHAVPHAAGRPVYATADGRFFVAESVTEPTTCAAPEGDCRAALRSEDGEERRSLTDAADLATREVVELEFPAADGPLGLVIAARHTFVSTYLFYQMLAYLGGEGGAFLAALERGEGDLAARVAAAIDGLARLEVSVEGPDGEWRHVGYFDEAGPLAIDRKLLHLPTGAPGQPIRVRLELAQGFWRIDQVGLVEISEPVEAHPLEPIRIERNGVEDDVSLAALNDQDRYLVTYPGDHFRLHFDVPPDAAPANLFLESRGYYYEWMRAEWLAEEAPLRVAAMLYDPGRMYREMAPAFKEIEPVIEEHFWNSRFRR